MIQTGKGLDENVGSLVLEFVAASDEKVEGFVEVEIVVAKKTPCRIFCEGLN